MTLSIFRNGNVLPPLLCPYRHGTWLALYDCYQVGTYPASLLFMQDVYSYPCIELYKLCWIIFFSPGKLLQLLWETLFALLSPWLQTTHYHPRTLTWSLSFHSRPLSPPRARAPRGVGVGHFSGRVDLHQLIWRPDVSVYICGVICCFVPLICGCSWQAHCDLSPTRARVSLALGLIHALPSVCFLYTNKLYFDTLNWSLLQFG